MNIIKSLCMRFLNMRANLLLWTAVRRADEKHRATGERQYVMPNAKRGDLIIMDRRNFRKLKAKGYISHAVKVIDLERECFYCTPYRDGKGKLPDMIVDVKRQQYFEWIKKK